MKKILIIIIGLLVTTYGFSQTNNYKSLPQLGIGLGMFDYPSAYAIKSHSLNYVLANKLWAKKDVGQALHLVFLYGVHNNIDLVANMAYGAGTLAFTKLNESTTSQKTIFNLDATAYFKLFSEKYVVSPYCLTGLGYSVVEKKGGAYWPVGVGAKINLPYGFAINVNGQYRTRLTKAQENHFYYLASLLVPMKEKKDVVSVPSVNVLPPVEVKPKTEEKKVETKDLTPVDKDTDGDGILDKDDKCPNVAGNAKYGGCPIPDSDGDGINDEQDKCPNVAGVAKYGGCPIPDSDGDGINDEQDQCPNVKGTVENNGCPDLKKQFNIETKNIQFETGSNILDAKAKVELDKLANVLNQNPAIKLQVDGYTDNTGNSEKNLILSQKRVESVKNYLVKNGIASDRLQTNGYGQNNPIGDNKTAEGRKLNRRVEIKTLE